jgi:hypothetical protein
LRDYVDAQGGPHNLMLSEKDYGRKSDTAIDNDDVSTHEKTRHADPKRASARNLHMYKHMV